VLNLMFPALVASLLLVGIHSYMGIHIIARGVIFVDLALAQVAALGWAAGGLGIAEHLSDLTGIPPTDVNYLIGLAATIVAAGLFAITRMDRTRVPQEAIIGIVYVVASAGTILLASQAARGSEHVEQLLTGNLLWVSWSDIGKTALIYLVIGAAHWTFRARFLALSLRPEDARAQGWSVAGWDFLFYALFGIMVTSSVAIAGVLVVFSFLVIPAVIAFLFTTRTSLLLTIAWTTGVAATVVGLAASYQTDLPTGPTIVCAFALALVLAFALRRLLRSHLPTDTRDGGLARETVGVSGAQ